MTDQTTETGLDLNLDEPAQQTEQPAEQPATGAASEPAKRVRTFGGVIVQPRTIIVDGKHVPMSDSEQLAKFHPQTDPPAPAA